MANDFIIKDSNGKDRVYRGVEYVTLITTSGNKVVFREPTETDLRTYGEYYVKALDYDGNIVKQEKLNAGDVFTLPTAPDHAGMEFKQWVSTSTIVDNAITVENKDITVYPVYIGTNNINEFSFEFTKKTGKSVTLNMDGTKDWGDGTSDNSTSHTYSDYGKYTVSCDGTTITASSSSGIFGQYGNVYGNHFTCIGAKLANVTKIPDYAFQNCKNLKYVIFPNSSCSIGASAFQYCYNLQNVIIPETVTSVGSYAFQYCYGLQNILILCSSDTLSSNLMRYCYSVKDVLLPNAVTQILSSFMEYCYNVKRLKFPSNVSTISSYAFRSCFGLIEYDFTDCSAIPTLSNTNAFSDINYSCKIYVPDELYDTWITATNWATYASCIYKASERGSV